MKIVSLTEITLNHSDLETLLRKEGLVANDLNLKRIIATPGSKGLRIEFEKITETSKVLDLQLSNMNKETFLDTSLRDVKLTVRVFNCLHAAGIKTPKELLEYTENDLLRFRNLGRKGINEINGILGVYGLILKKI